jgi:D-alanyl-D-alanine dipeptidase
VEVSLRWSSAAALALLLAACAGLRGGEPVLISPTNFDPRLRLDIRYATPDNFVGAAIDGYEAPLCLLTPEAAQALSWVARDLRRDRLALVIFDCYRPQRAVDHFVRWVALPEDPAARAAYYPNVPKSELFERGYIAERSSHSRGSTVDVGLVRDGELVDMGTPFDFFDPLSHTDAVGGQPRVHRQTLRAAMERRGFRNYPKEWWHYTLAPEPHAFRYFDVPVR